MNKNIIFVACIILTSCATTQDAEERVAQHEREAAEAVERAIKLGNYPGSPENDEAIQREFKRARDARARAQEESEEESFFDFVLDLILGD